MDQILNQEGVVAENDQKLVNYEENVGLILFGVADNAWEHLEILFGTHLLVVVRQDAADDRVVVAKGLSIAVYEHFREIAVFELD